MITMSGPQGPGRDVGGAGNHQRGGAAAFATRRRLWMIAKMRRFGCQQCLPIANIRKHAAKERAAHESARVASGSMEY